MGWLRPCNCIAAAFTLCSFCFLPLPCRCWCQEHFPINLLHTNLHFRICFLRNLTWNSRSPFWWPRVTLYWPLTPLLHIHCQMAFRIHFLSHLLLPFLHCMRCSDIISAAPHTNYEFSLSLIDIYLHASWILAGAFLRERNVSYFLIVSSQYTQF